MHSEPFRSFSQDPLLKIGILCGGSGTRLWPLSRREFPKQFINIFGGKSFLHHTIERNAPISQSMMVVSGAATRSLTLTELACFPNITFQPLFEPSGKNTAPAISLACVASQPEDILLIVPADHIIRNSAAYQQTIAQAISLAQKGRIVTFGIPPTYPATGYGYIEADTQTAIRANIESDGGAGIKTNPTNPTDQTDQTSQSAQSGPLNNAATLNHNLSHNLSHSFGYPVRRFHEKPDRHTATRYLESGHFYWNSGMFCFQVSTMLDALATFSPNTLQIAYDIQKSSPDLSTILPEQMARFEPISIDYAVMEKSDQLTVLPATFEWDDIGTFDALSRLISSDDPLNQNAGDGNISIGKTLLENCTNTSVLSHSDSQRLVAGLDLDNITIVDTPDSVLVFPSGSASKVGQLAAKVTPPDLRNAHRTVQKPWGSYTVLDKTEAVQVKRIELNPGHRLSYQFHKQRDEHWIIVQGRALLTINDVVREVGQQDSVHIPRLTRHRIQNVSDVPVVFIETQFGDYLGEEDITRLQDDYHRDR